MVSLDIDTFTFWDILELTTAYCILDTLICKCSQPLHRSGHRPSSRRKSLLQDLSHLFTFLFRERRILTEGVDRCPVTCVSQTLAFRFLYSLLHAHIEIDRTYTRLWNLWRPTHRFACIVEHSKGSVANGLFTSPWLSCCHFASTFASTFLNWIQHRHRARNHGTYRHVDLSKCSGIFRLEAASLEPPL